MEERGQEVRKERRGGGERERVEEDDELAYYVTCKMTWHTCRTCGQI